MSCADPEGRLADHVGPTVLLQGRGDGFANERGRIANPLLPVGRPTRPGCRTVVSAWTAPDQRDKRYSAKPALRLCSMLGRLS